MLNILMAIIMITIAGFWDYRLLYAGNFFIKEHCSRAKALVGCGIFVLTLIACIYFKVAYYHQLAILFVLYCLTTYVIYHSSTITIITAALKYSCE